VTVSHIQMAQGGPKFSRFAQGFGGAVRWGKSTQEMLEYVQQCVELGVTTLDNAAIYGDGQCETLLGDALALVPSLRDEVELVTKCSIGTWDTSIYHYDTSKAHILWSAEQSLQKLRTDRIDLLLIHRPDPLMDADEVAEAFAQLRQSGKVLHFGVSNFTPFQYDLLASRLNFPLVTNEIQFSAMYLQPWYDGTLAQCQQLRIVPMVWSPLGGGRLFHEETRWAEHIRSEMYAAGKALGGVPLDRVALAWILKHPARMVPILGTGKIERVRSAVQAEYVELSREQWFRIWVASTEKRLP
jgi:predicted oxidoreductase